MFYTGKNFAFDEVLVRTELSEYWNVYSVIHQVNKIAFYKLAFGFIYFKPCLSSSAHTLLLEQKEQPFIMSPGLVSLYDEAEWTSTVDNRDVSICPTRVIGINYT